MKDHAMTKHRDRLPQLRPRALVALLTLAAVMCVGCGRDDLNTSYGRHRFPGQSGSVNGTDVLAAMFEEAGHAVHFRRTLVTDDMVDADVIVWFPNDFSPPREEVTQWFDDWLAEYPLRTVVIVGRDFDAAPQYFDYLRQQREKTGGQAGSKGRGSGSGRLPDLAPEKEEAKDDRDKEDKGDQEDKTEDESAADQSEENQPTHWFHYEEASRKQIKEIAGTWAEGIDADKARIELNSKLVPDRGVTRLLTSGDDLLIGQLTDSYWDEGQVLLVANGSFLLNLPLVNKENRKLAGKLIEAAGEPVEVVFLESGPGGPPIDPPYTDNSLWTLFRGWPLGAILLQLAAVGVIFCFSRWPVFGRPRRPAAEPTADFAKHVAAVGRLLARTRELPPAPGTPAHAVAPSAVIAPSALASGSSEVRSSLARRPPALPPETRGK